MTESRYDSHCSLLCCTRPCVRKPLGHDDRSRSHDDRNDRLQRDDRREPVSHVPFYSGGEDVPFGIFVPLLRYDLRIEKNKCQFLMLPDAEEAW